MGNSFIRPNAGTTALPTNFNYDTCKSFLPTKGIIGVNSAGAAVCFTTSEGRIASVRFNSWPSHFDHFPGKPTNIKGIVSFEYKVWK
jgi:hypothetical protein